MAESKSTLATAGGLAALAIWSTTAAFSRSMSESLGAMTAGSMVFLIGGGLSLLIALLRGQSPAAMLRLDRRYLLGCGAMFVAYMLCLYPAIAITLVRPRAVALVVFLLNYLWPTLMVAFSVPILGCKARLGMLIVGCALSVTGTAVAMLSQSAGDRASGAAAPTDILAGIDKTSMIAFALGGCAGVLWALYSNCARRWNNSDQGAVPLFMLASSAAMGLSLLVFPEQTLWKQQAVAEMVGLAIGSMAIAYVLWEAGVRRGNHRLLGLTSYFLPVASMGVAALYLRILPSAGLWIGCGLVVVGAIVCKKSLGSSDV